MLTFVFIATFGCSQPKAAIVVSDSEEPSPAIADSVVDEDGVELGLVEYETGDSIEVVKLLNDTALTSTLDYARYFLNRPYVAHTLDGAYTTEGGGKEHLVVNLRELDCLTLLETCNALALSAGGNWTDYCKSLQKLRYFNGEIEGYASRLHYLTFSIADHLRRGTMEEVVLPPDLTRTRKVRLNFMSRHPQYYDALKNDTALTQKMAGLEQHYSGEEFRYLPQENCGLSRKRLDAVRDGDIVYIVTSKDGLDYAHQGYAFWGKDGKLHMLHASSDRKRVIADERPLDVYLQRISSSIGIRVFRLMR